MMLMNDKRTNESPLLFIKDSLIGENVKRSLKTLADLRGVFHNCEAYEQMSPDTLLYEVTCHLPVEEGTPGGLYFGITRIYPGKVGDEYFMTKGHFHANMNRGEYYWGVEGEGRLIMMDQNRRVWSERMFPGSLHYIPGGVAHRVANIGYSVLSFAACWPSDAGHDYQVILENGFSASLQCREWQSPIDRNMNMKYIIAVDLGGTITKVGLLRNGELVDYVKMPSRQDLDMTASLPEIENAIDFLLNSNGVKRLFGVGIAFPGLVNNKKSNYYIYE